MNWLKPSCLALLAVLASFEATAGTGALPANKLTTAGLYLTAAEARDFRAAHKTLFVDVRSRAEVNFLGLPTDVDVNIPYMELTDLARFDPEKGTYKLEPNPDFPLVFEKELQKRGLGKDTAILLMCRSGTRSAKAANLLTSMGYTRVYSVVDGFEGDTAKAGPAKGRRTVNGWKNAGLPWSYKLAPGQVYPPDRK
ncbi:hypothetical protein GCM10017083_31940 [Thalassobaculum fulvum]|uniref:Rhodanese domain-containing protein n=1 Tax=Thalassobaculum fulvum TaxID=1633335 RepID=A0A918XTJ0_9PROT|nr:rhodanese-like domain-containing protein [Thalassobaculum fulvum]GHD54436.1 hypothetical protein GCM10017083_31940 [Thalassobaculum fulvum]